MRAALFGKYLKGQLRNLTPHQLAAARWWHHKSEEDVFPSDEWINESETNYEASFLIADIKNAAEDGKEIDFTNYFRGSSEVREIAPPTVMNIQ